MTILAYILSFSCLILNSVLFLRIRPPFNWMIPMLTTAFSPFLVVTGGLGAWLGWLYQAPLAVAAGLLGAGVSLVYITLVTAPQPGFELAFGKDWKTRIPPSRKRHMLRWRWNLLLPRVSASRWERDLPFWTIPGTERKLLCDVWQPPEGVARSGLAFIYLHGSAWWVLDKDNQTRPFFRHLAAQGHVIMDVAYRLCPEVDIYGMVGDAKRAVAWMKTNASQYQVNSERIVLGGGSAGGHLSLLAAYAPHHPGLMPADVDGCDLSVRAVISYYGPTDLKAVYEYTHQRRWLEGQQKVEIGSIVPMDQKEKMSNAGRMDTLLGGHLHEVPEVYALASPVTHVSSECPPTLLIQGVPDVYTPAAAARELHRRLVECGVPAVNIMYPLTNHAFDLLLPQVSPPTHAALYYVERFLALMA